MLFFARFQNFRIMAITTVALLTGCASGPQVVESAVTSYSSLPALLAPASPPTYRVERLPSQQAHADTWLPIEAQAHLALARVGLQRDDEQPSLVAYINAAGVRMPPPWARHWPYVSHVYYVDPFYGSFGWSWGWSYRVWDGSMDEHWPLLRHSVNLVLRDAATGQVVYETSAVHEDAGSRFRTDESALYGVLFDQALDGFPQPPEGKRTVRTPSIDRSSVGSARQ